MFQLAHMNCAAAIECHRQPLLRIVATLYAMIGLAEGGMIERVKRPIYRKVLGLLRPAEWAVRRLIVIAAQGLRVESQAARKAHKKPASAVKTRSKDKSKRRRAFALVDPQRREYGFGFRRRSVHPAVGPRIRSFDTPTGVLVYVNGFPPAPPQLAPEPDGSVSGTALCRRLDAIRRALQDLPGQAQRYARLRAKAVAEPDRKCNNTLRRLPPAHPRRKPQHEVHAILEECDWLVRTLPKTDTS
jgi:hypothetical protein